MHAKHLAVFLSVWTVMLSANWYACQANEPRPLALIEVKFILLAQLELGALSGQTVDLRGTRGHSGNQKMSAVC